MSAALLAALLVSCSDDDGRPPPANWRPFDDGPPSIPVQRLPPTTAAYRATPCPVLPPSDTAIDCGAVTVPENHANPAGPTIELSVVRFFSGSTAASDVPVVYLEGGPGGAAVENVAAGFSAFEHVTAHRDLVVFDQRGTGFSTPSLDCPEADNVSTAVGDPDAEDLLAPIQACHDRLATQGVALGDYNTAQNAADVAAIRVALGYEQWDLYGISYGTRLALTTLRDHPVGVRSAIIDGVLPLEIDTLSVVPGSAERSFTLLFGYCTANSFCRSRFPDPMSQLVQVIANLETNPAVLHLEDGTTMELTGDIVLSLLFILLYDVEALPFVPAIIDLTASGEYSLYETLFSSMSESSIVSLGMYLSVTCTDDAPFSSPAALAAAADIVAPPFDGFADALVFDECAIWNVPPSPPLEDQPVVSAIPTLIVSGELDPITPPAYGELVAASLANGEHHVLPGQSHGASISSCGADLVDQFLAAPGPIENPNCVERLGPPDFESALRSRRSGVQFAPTAPSQEDLEAMASRISARWR